jgi:hypothetical protein
MSDDGRFVFFQSAAALAPGALNDRPVTGNPKVLAQNVYEWEAEGSGGCVQPAGCVWLISDGRDLNEGPQIATSVVELLGSDASGQNVFFKTADQLVPADTDTQVDFYDARVGGGFPASVVSVPCEGQQCREAPSVPGAFGAPPSQFLTGPGNLAPQPPLAPPAKALTARQKLAKALAACRRRYRAKRTRGRRLACERQTRRKYGQPGAKHSRTHGSGKR